MAAPDAPAAGGSGAATGAAAPAGLVVASWRQLIDSSAANDYTPALVATAKPAVAMLNPAAASGLGLGDGDLVDVMPPFAGG